MKRGWIFALPVAIAIATPAPAQYVSDTETFVKAVADRDGDKVTEVLQKRGPAVLNARSANGDTALMTAVLQRDSTYTAFLLQKGADPNYATGDGERPLIAAARLGFDDAVEWMLAKGANVDATNRMGETALIVAVQQRRAPIVEMLLEAGADPDKTDSAAGYSARDYAKRDTRSRRMLELIEAASNKPEKAKTLDEFKL